MKGEEVQSVNKEEETETSLRMLDFLRQHKRRYEMRLGFFAKPVQFLCVGTTGAIVDLSSLMFFTELMPWGIARALAIWLATTWVFWLNRRLTCSYARTASALAQYLKFCGSYSFGGTVNWLVSVAVLHYSRTSRLMPMIAAVCSTRLSRSASRSIRAASTACTVAGIATRSIEPVSR